jgi:putative membrane protein insertion efficiency factor
MNQTQRRGSHSRKHWRRLLFFAYLFIFICIGAEWGYAGETRSPQQKIDDETNFATFPIRMYQKFLSAGDGHRCPMMPSCSQYSIEAFRKHGYLLGWIMTSDRLLRCGRDETRLSETRTKNNETYSYDPLRNNDFWWFHER